VKRLWIIISALAGCSFLASGQTPAITAVLDAASNSANVAPGGFFVVKGSNLAGANCASTSVPGWANNCIATTLPLATSIANVKITFSGATTADAYMYYVLGQQLSGILPSTIAPGSYNVTVTNGTNVSAAFKATVIAHKFELFTVDQTGSGLAAMENFVSQSQIDLHRYTTGTLGSYTTSPAHPGQIVELFGTGLGAISVADNTAPGAIDFSKQLTIQVTVGGEVVPVSYAGRQPQFPGEDQINITLPSDVATGCSVSLQVTVNGVASNAGTTMAVAPAGAAACVNPLLTSSQLAKLDSGGTLTVGNFALTSFGTKVNVPGLPNSVTAKAEYANGTFAQYPGGQLAAAQVFVNPAGGCQVFHRVADQAGLIFGTGFNLDAGASISLNGPNASNKLLMRQADNSYQLSLGTALVGLTLPPGVTLPPGLGFSTTPVIAPGTYTIAGTGGKDVGSFQASVTVGPPLTLTADLPTTVPRNKDLTVSWTGGNPTDSVILIGLSGTLAGGNQADPVFDAGIFICATTAGKGSITANSSILSQLPATPADAQSNGTGIGALLFASDTQPTPGNGIFTAPLTAGGNVDLGVFIGTIGFLSQALFQ